MGYRGKLEQQNRARALRAQAWTLSEIAATLEVAKSSVSLWVRNIEFDESVRARRAGTNRNRGAQSRGPNKLARRKQAEIDRLLASGRERIGVLSDRDLLIAGTALYAGEGSKSDGDVKFANSDPQMIVLFLRWLRRFFAVDESRLRLRLYLHEGLDLTVANGFWSQLTGIPLVQFGKPYRAKADPSIRRSKHPMGCHAVAYRCCRTHREIMGLVRALLESDDCNPG